MKMTPSVINSVKARGEIMNIQDIKYISAVAAEGSVKKAAQKLLSPLMRPLMGLPGSCGLTLIASLQSTDAAASMTKGLCDDGYITEKQKAVFCAFQFSGASAITNFFASGAALFPFIGDIPIFKPLALILIMKFVGANVLRFYLNKFDKEDE